MRQLGSLSQEAAISIHPIASHTGATAVGGDIPSQVDGGGGLRWRVQAGRYARRGGVGRWSNYVIDRYGDGAGSCRVAGSVSGYSPKGKAGISQSSRIPSISVRCRRIQRTQIVAVELEYRDSTNRQYVKSTLVQLSVYSQGEADALGLGDRKSVV